MISFILDFATFIFIKIPLAIVLVYFMSIVGSSFFGGPVWLWFIITTLISIVVIKEDFDKAKRKTEQENNC